MKLYVNGETIDPKEVELEIHKLRPEYEQTFAQMGKEEREKQLFEWAQENVVERTLLYQAAKGKLDTIADEKVEKIVEDIKKKNADSKELDISDLKIKIRHQLALETMLFEVSEKAQGPTDEQIEEYYNEHIERFMIPEHIRVSHIVKHPGPFCPLAKCKEIMEQVQTEINNGKSFESIVGVYSDCPDKGGDLGWISRGKMVEEFEDVVFNLGENQLSNVFETRFGFHIAKVYARKAPEKRSLEDVKEGISKHLHEETRTEALEAYIDHLKDNAEIRSE